jgi:hypothetical protein
MGTWRDDHPWDRRCVTPAAATDVAEVGVEEGSVVLLPSPDRIATDGEDNAAM